MKAAVFCHSGLGDAIISMTLSHNLKINNWSVDTYHNGIQSLQRWFPDLPLHYYPTVGDIPKILSEYDKILVFHNDTNDFVLELIRQGKKKDPEKVKVIYGFPSKKLRELPYYKDCLINPNICIAKNLESFCRKILGFPKTVRHNGCVPPDTIKSRKYPTRVAMHVTSSREGKNWPIHKYVKLALHLKKRGYQPAFIVGSSEEREAWLYLEKHGFLVPSFKTLDDAAKFICESGFLIGNDSGFGHLASCLRVPTVTISRRKMIAQFWRPGWTTGKIVTPASWIPNTGVYRLRDRHWKKLVSVQRVLNSFLSLARRHEKERPL